MHIRRINHVLLCVLDAVAARAVELPAEVADYIYYEYTSFQASLSARDTALSAVLLNRDGTYSGLFRAGNVVSVVAKNRRLPVTNVPDGRYSYKKLSAQAAELTLDYTISGQQTRMLIAGTDTSGSISATGPNSARFLFTRRNWRGSVSNSSSLSVVLAGGTTSMGFIVPSGCPILVRAIGPGLSAFGITGRLRSPVLRIFRAGDTDTDMVSSDWTSESETAMNRTGALVGAFPLQSTTKDAALILGGAEGIEYVAQVSSPDPLDTGQVLLELYALPFSGFDPQ